MIKSTLQALLGIFVLSAAILGCQMLSDKSPDTFRNPASTLDLITGSRDILNNLKNPQVFNAETCAPFVGKMTDYLYRLPADYFVPKNSREIEMLKRDGDEVMDTLFQIRVTLHEKLQEFDARNQLSPDCVLKMREGTQYSRFAEEYLLEWLTTRKVYKYEPTPILSNSKPSTWTNPKFAGFKLKSGDVMVVRGKSYVSAMIARIADEEGNFSHVAIIGEDKKGQQYVVEALIQTGTIITPLEKWRQQPDARVALFRQPNEALAKMAARKIYDRAREALDHEKGIRYDFAMDDSNYTTFFCSEVIRYAYDKASQGKFMVPKFRSSISKFKNNEYPKSLGVTMTSLFAPYDMEVDPRFDLVAEHRYFPLLRQVRMQDSVLQSMYGWMINKNYNFEWSQQHSVKAGLAKFLRQFGFVADTLPKYMPVASIQTTVKFQTVAEALEKNLYATEAEFYKKNGYLPSFQDMMKVNEDFRKADCEKFKKWRANGADSQTAVSNSKFHWFFRSDAKSCN